MDITNQQTLIERFAEKPQYLDHADNYEKCGVCLKQMIQYEVCKEFVLKGQITNEYVPAMEQEVNRRWQESELYLEIQKLKSSGKTLDEAIAIMESRGYYP